jgi:hypothetical protein
VLSALNDAAVIKHEDLICGCDGAEPVRNRNGGPTPHRALERLLHVSLGDRVKRRGCLVKQENRRVLQEHARNSEALPLSAGELVSALPYNRVKSEWKFAHAFRK